MQLLHERIKTSIGIGFIQVSVIDQVYIVSSSYSEIDGLTGDEVAIKSMLPKSIDDEVARVVIQAVNAHESALEEARCELDVDNVDYSLVRAGSLDDFAHLVQRL